MTERMIENSIQLAFGADGSDPERKTGRSVPAGEGKGDREGPCRWY